MTGFQTLRRIIIPEALKIALPNFGNNLLNLIKGTSLAFSISVVDIVAAADMIGARAYRFFEVYRCCPHLLAHMFYFDIPREPDRKAVKS